MRQQLLHGYVLHQKPYRETSRLVQYFSLELGRVDGVARQALPALYQPSLLYASGKTALKNFSKIETVGALSQLRGPALLAGFYLNELLVRLLPLEEPFAELFAAYASAVDGLQQLGEGNDAGLRAVLRRFEAKLLQVLGGLPAFDRDDQGRPIDPKARYDYVAGSGFVARDQGAWGGRVLLDFALDDMQQAAPLALAGQVFRQEIARQLGGKPLHSRELWRQLQQTTATQSPP